MLAQSNQGKTEKFAVFLDLITLSFTERVIQASQMAQNNEGPICIDVKFCFCLNLFEVVCTSNCCMFDWESIVLVWNIPTQFSQNTALHSSLIIFNRQLQAMLLWLSFAC